jgi:hypothetical protein
MARERESNKSGRSNGKERKEKRKENWIQILMEINHHLFST